MEISDNHELLEDEALCVIRIGDSPDDVVQATRCTPFRRFETSLTFGNHLNSYEGFNIRMQVNFYVILTHLPYWSIG